jgi:hypothetical protein
MLVQSLKNNHALLLTAVGSLAWLVPGGGHFALGERRRAAVICLTILLTFLVGLYAGSIGVIDPLGARAWYFAQVLTSPVVMIVGSHVANVQRLADQEASNGQAGKTVPYHVYGRPGEIGQIYTSIAGLLNLLCIVNAMYVAHQMAISETQSTD